MTLFSKAIFTLIKKNVRDLVVGNNEYTRDEGFLEGLWRKTFFDSTNFLLLFWLHWFAFLALTQSFMIFTA